MFFVSGDIKFFLVAASFLFVPLMLGYLYAKKIGMGRSQILNDREIIIFFKIIGILIFVFLFLFVNIALEYPAEQFIYGRF